MEEKELRTSTKTRIFIIAIAVIMVGSIIASYAAIVASGSKSTGSGEVDEEKVAEYKEAFEETQEEFTNETYGDFEDFIEYKSEIAAYNESKANEGGVQTKDLKLGTGKKLTKDDTDYLAYYVGWCADESIFDSSFDNNDDPDGFKSILDPSVGLIEGWSLGVEGMKVGGIREVTIPGDLAYGDSMEICGGKNKPIKFMIMTKENSGELADLYKELQEANLRYQYAMSGIDYDAMMGADAEEEDEAEEEDIEEEE